MTSHQMRREYRIGKLRHQVLGLPGHYLSFLPNKGAIWYRVAKVGTRSIDRMLREAEPDYYYGGYETALREQFASAHFRFAFVRNPVSRLVSLYANKVLDQNDLRVSEAVRNELRDFDAFIEWIGGHDLTSCNPHWRFQSRLIPEEGMDFIGRLETFADDWSACAQRMGLGVPGVLPRANASSSSDLKIRPDQVLRIQQLYQKDMERFYPESV